MFINPITAAMGAIQLLSEATSHHKKEENKTTTDLASTYNVNNMSLNDLKGMALGLMQQGKLSESDANNFLSQITSIEQSAGISKDAKVDMVHLYEQQVQNLNVGVKSKEVASFQHSLDILKGVKALSGANIPRSV